MQISLADDQAIVNFYNAILNHPSDDLDELLALAKSLQPDWDEEDDNWVRMRVSVQLQEEKPMTNFEGDAGD